jgi:hypothetical protein
MTTLKCYLPSIAEPGIYGWREPRVCINNGENPDLGPGAKGSDTKSMAQVLL